MAVTAKKRDYEYNEFTDEMIHLISYNNIDSTIVGSASMKFNYANDYDLFTIVHSNKSLDALKRDVYNTFRKMCKEIDKLDHVYFIELMAGVDEEGKALNWSSPDVMKGTMKVDGKEYKFMDILDEQSVIKMEVVGYFNGIFLPFSNVFEFKRFNKGINQPKTTIDSIPSLAREIVKYHDKKSYMKVLKRLFIIALQTKNRKLADTLIDIFQGDIGKIYKVKSSIATVKAVLELYHDGLTIHRIKDNVSGMKEVISSQASHNFGETFYHLFDVIVSSKSVASMIDAMENVVEQIETVVNKLLLHQIKLHKINYKQYLKP